MAADDAILVSNTSSIPIMKVAVATSRRDRVVGLHLCNPVPVLGLVEVIPSLLTSDETSAAVTAFATNDLNKHAIRSKDRAGFIVNALLSPTSSLRSGSSSRDSPPLLSRMVDAGLLGRKSGRGFHTYD